MFKINNFFLKKKLSFFLIFLKKNNKGFLYFKKQNFKKRLQFFFKIKKKKLFYNNKLLVLKKKFVCLQLEKLLSSLLFGFGKFFLNMYNIKDWVWKPFKRFYFEKKLSRKLKFALSKRMVNILQKGFFSFNFITKLLGWCFKLVGLGYLFIYYISLQIKAIKSHWVVLKVLEFLLKKYFAEYKNIISGIKLLLKGKINNSLRTRKYFLLNGVVNQQSFCSTIDYAQVESFSLTGIFTIRFWLQYK